MIRDLNQQAPQQPQGPRVTQKMVEEAPTVACLNCGGEYIITTVSYKLISKIVLGTPEPALVPVPVHRCFDCGELFDMDEAIKGLQEKNK